MVKALAAWPLLLLINMPECGVDMPGFMRAEGEIAADAVADRLEGEMVLENCAMGGAN